MHEVSLVSEMIGLAESEVARAAAGGRVLRLKISVGPLSCASAEALRFAFELLASGTSVEGAELEIDEPPLVCHCQECGARSEAADAFAGCPACGASRVSLDGSRDVRLESIEVED
ncbi:MAG TPA: hydrogenase maturation nickel metallochaperone HypA [Sumerlaeia bacterium]|nr:hydrogenase maturation nickel metallochaperone HypA [Sumerlaeia bacterium]